jgi:hypothetical protein
MRRVALLGMFISEILLVSFSVGCLASASRDEVAAVPSPDGEVEAVVIETNGGATTSFGYEIQLRDRNRRHSERVAYIYGAVRNEKAYGVNVKWMSNRELRLQYLTAKNETLERPSVVIAGHEISVGLQMGVLDPSAPAGGMLYNLHDAVR